MTKETIKKIVDEVFEELFPELKRGKFDFKRNQNDFRDWDSFMHMKLISTFEEKLGIMLNVAEFVDADCPMKFADLIYKNKPTVTKIDKTKVDPIFKNLSEALYYWQNNNPEKIFIKS